MPVLAQQLPAQPKGARAEGFSRSSGFQSIGKVEIDEGQRTGVETAASYRLTLQLTERYTAGVEPATCPVDKQID